MLSTVNKTYIQLLRWNFSKKPVKENCAEDCQQELQGNCWDATKVRSQLKTVLSTANKNYKETAGMQLK